MESMSAGVAVAPTNKSLAQRSKPPKVAAGVVQKYSSDKSFIASIWLVILIYIKSSKNVPDLECNLVPPHLTGANGSTHARGGGTSPTDAQVIAALASQTWLSMGDVGEETTSSWDYRIADGNVCKCWTRSRTPWTLGFTGSMANE
jgi:hypothetical protein